MNVLGLMVSIEIYGLELIYNDKCGGEQCLTL